ncbi:TonB-dependent receptor [uncultured Duncaniella sp.]|uniref:TonB-dependent receptor n=1 Tax=uncultured Duncaniella sp. TaxID=2768039 RepID=UPI00260EE790|nr:TonB-dependent receptor [uncultured Duncaniella sp.]
MNPIVQFITALFLFCMLAVPMEANAQTERVSVKGGQLSQVFKEIEKQTKYTFVYRDNINPKSKISVNAQQRPLSEVLNEILSPLGLTYSLNNRTITIAKAPSKSPAKSSGGKGQAAISGKVLDKAGEPLIGVSVRCDKTGAGAVTDLEGNYTIEAPEGSNLTFTYVGYTPTKRKVNNAGQLNVTLSEDSKVLDEVVVVGYGTMKKRDLTGAVSTVNLSDDPIGTTSSVSRMLAGKAAGLQVNTPSAQPGGATNFLIRGAASVNASNSPLFIIDGFPVNSTGDVGGGYYTNGANDNILGQLNPNDIESIDVLKDASSTAIYGSRAANGVIIITTKKGAQGSPKVQYSGSVSVQTIADKYKMENARGWMEAVNAINYDRYMRDCQYYPYGHSHQENPAFVPTYTAEQIANAAHDTDWFDEISRTGFQTQHNLSISGGTQYTKYLISGNIFRQNGVIKNNDLTRYTLRSNLEQKIGRMVTVGLNMFASSATTHDVPLGGHDGPEFDPIITVALKMNPLLPVRDENGNYTLPPKAAYTPNPVSMLDIENKYTRERLMTNGFVEIKPWDFLSFRANLGLDRTNMKRRVYMPKSTLYGAKVGGQADINEFDKTDYLLDLIATFNKNFGDHSLTAMVGYSYQRFTAEFVNAGNQDFTVESFGYNNLGAGNFSKPSVASGRSSNELASFFGRVSYSFGDRYLLTATIRADGASNFSQHHRWGYFPSVAAAWRFSSEEFLEGANSWLSNGKLRLSWGQTGNSSIGNRTSSEYSPGTKFNFGNSLHTGYGLTQLGNNNLKWETTTEWNLGLDLGFFNNRINLTAEYFNRVISNLLSTRPLMSFNQISAISDNIGKTQSQGVELTLNTINFNTPDFMWSTDFTFSFYRDRWKERADTWVASAWDKYDGPIRYASGYVSDGLIMPDDEVPYMIGNYPGQIKILDIDGYQYNADGTIKVDEHGIPLKTGAPDGKLDDADKIMYATTDPGYLAGFGNTLRWKNFDFNIYFYGMFQVFRNGSYLDQTDYINGVDNEQNFTTAWRDAWSSTNLDGKNPGYNQAYSGYGNGDFFAKRFYMIRCRNITLGYTLPKIKGISKLRFYLDVNNPFKISNYKGLDLETGDTNSYPNVRSYSFGLEFSL